MIGTYNDYVIGKQLHESLIKKETLSWAAAKNHLERVLEGYNFIREELRPIKQKVYK